MAEVTIYTIAKELNMSPSMVSRAFNPSCKVSEEKRRLILETARKYSFSPNKMASRLSMKTVKIGILINSRFHVNTEKMLNGIALAYERLKDYKVDYDITVVNPSEQKDFDYTSLLEKYAEYDGVIVSGLSSEKHTAALSGFYEKNKNLVQVQAINSGARFLFASKHNEETASLMACEFLYDCLRFSERKNVLLFIGDKESALHASAAEAFSKACAENGMKLLETVENGDSEEFLSEIVPKVFEKYKGLVDGVYTTSGISSALCDYIEKSGSQIPLVTFDTHDDIRSYMKKGVISATIAQNVTHQMDSAFECLAKYIINGEEPQKTIFTDVQLVLKSNIHQFD